MTSFDDALYIVHLLRPLLERGETENAARAFSTLTEQRPLGVAFRDICRACNQTAFLERYGAVFSVALAGISVAPQIKGDPNKCFACVKAIDSKKSYAKNALVYQTNYCDSCSNALVARLTAWWKIFEVLRTDLSQEDTESVLELLGLKPDLTNAATTLFGANRREFADFVDCVLAVGVNRFNLFLWTHLPYPQNVENRGIVWKSKLDFQNSEHKSEMPPNATHHMRVGTGFLHGFSACESSFHAFLLSSGRVITGSSIPDVKGELFSLDPKNPLAKSLDYELFRDRYDQMLEIFGKTLFSAIDAQWNFRPFGVRNSAAVAAPAVVEREDPLEDLIKLRNERRSQVMRNIIPANNRIQVEEDQNAFEEERERQEREKEYKITQQAVVEAYQKRKEEERKRERADKELELTELRREQAARNFSASGERSRPVEPRSTTPPTSVFDTYKMVNERPNTSVPDIRKPFMSGGSLKSTAPPPSLKSIAATTTPGNTNSGLKKKPITIELDNESPTREMPVESFPQKKLKSSQGAVFQTAEISSALLESQRQEVSRILGDPKIEKQPELQQVLEEITNLSAEYENSVDEGVDNMSNPDFNRICRRLRAAYDKLPELVAFYTKYAPRAEPKSSKKDDNEESDSESENPNSTKKKIERPFEFINRKLNLSRYFGNPTPTKLVLAKGNQDTRILVAASPENFLESHKTTAQLTIEEFLANPEYFPALKESSDAPLQNLITHDVGVWVGSFRITHPEMNDTFQTFVNAVKIAFVELTFMRNMNLNARYKMRDILKGNVLDILPSNGNWEDEDNWLYYTRLLKLFRKVPDSITNHFRNFTNATWSHQRIDRFWANISELTITSVYRACGESTSSTPTFPIIVRCMELVLSFAMRYSTLNK